MIIMKIANEATIHEKNFEGAIPVDPESGLALGLGAAAEGDPDPDPALTSMASFIGPLSQWLPIPQMYHFFPGVARGMTSFPVVKGAAVNGGAHSWNSVAFTLMTLCAPTL